MGDLKLFAFRVEVLQVSLTEQCPKHRLHRIPETEKGNYIHAIILIVSRQFRAVYHALTVRNTNLLLTKNAVVTGKYETEILTYIKDRCLIFSRNDQAIEVNKRFII